MAPPWSARDARVARGRRGPSRRPDGPWTHRSDQDDAEGATAGGPPTRSRRRGRAVAPAESSWPPAPARIQADQVARPALTPRLELASELRNDVEPAGRRGARQRCRDGALYSIITTSRTWRFVRRSWRFVRRRQNLGVLAAFLGGWIPVFSRRWATFGTDGAVGFDSPWGRKSYFV